MFDILKKLLSAQGLDTAQAAADVGGVFDQSGATDLANAGVSLLRGLTSGNSKDRGRHFSDAGIRAISAIPLLGDLAKLGRTGRYVEEGSRLVGGMKRRSSLMNLLGMKGDDSAEDRNTPANHPQGSATPAFPSNAGIPASRQTGMKGMLGGMMKWMSGRDDSDLKSREAYFSGSVEYRQKQRTTSGSAFYDKTEAWDERFRAAGLETESAKRRRKDRQFQERVHQQFLADPTADVSRSTSRVKAAKRTFDTDRQSLLDERADEERAKVADGLKSLTSSLKGAVTAILTLPPAVSKFGEMLVEAKRATGMFEGSTASRLAQGDLQRMQLNMRTGRNTSSSTNAMLDEMAKFRESYQPLRENYTNLTTTMSRASIFVGRMAADLSNVVLQVTQIQTILDWFYNDENGKKAKGGGETRTQAMVRNLTNPDNINRGVRQPLPPL